MQEANTWRCTQGHSFDIARQGYVNLLPVQNKRSRDPGDSKTMIVARQEFLVAGFYQPIADADEDCICLAGMDAPLAFKGLIAKMLQPIFKI